MLADRAEQDRVGLLACAKRRRRQTVAGRRVRRRTYGPWARDLQELAALQLTEQLAGTGEDLRPDTVSGQQGNRDHRVSSSLPLVVVMRRTSSALRSPAAAAIHCSIAGTTSG